MNIFWPAEIGGRGRPPPRPGRHLQHSAGTSAAGLRWQFVYGPRSPSDRRAREKTAAFVAGGPRSPRAVAVSALGGELHKSPASAKKPAGRFLPCSGRERVLPRSQGATRRWRSRKEAERERKSGRAGLGLAMGRPGPSRGCFGKFRRRSAPQHRHAPGQAQASREGRRALSPALKSHRRPSHFPSILLVAVSFPSPPSTPARKHTTSLLLPRGKSSTTTSVYLWKKE